MRLDWRDKSVANLMNFGCGEENKDGLSGCVGCVGERVRGSKGERTKG